MLRKVFISKLNTILDDCGKDMPGGGNRRPFLAYSWKKHSSSSNLNLVDISRFKEIKNILLEHGKWDAYLELMLLRRD